MKKNGLPGKAAPINHKKSIRVSPPDTSFLFTSTGGKSVSFQFTV